MWAACKTAQIEASEDHRNYQREREGKSKGEREREGKVEKEGTVPGAGMTNAQLSPQGTPPSRKNKKSVCSRTSRR